MKINGISGFISPGATKLSTVSKADRTSKARAAMTDEYIAKIQAHAREDAKSNVYMGKSYVAMEQAYVAKNVSPDRAGAISQVSGTLNTIMRSASRLGDTLLKLLDSYSAKIQRGQTKTTAEIYNEYGEMIAGYHSDNGCWTSVPTDAEEAFWNQANQIYYDAYTAARAEINAAKQTATPAASGDAPASFDVKA